MRNNLVVSGEIDPELDYFEEGRTTFFFGEMARA